MTLTLRKNVWYYHKRRVFAMKMKEVTEQTGLTERTVRYYMEKGLIAPHGQWRNGREY